MGMVRIALKSTTLYWSHGLSALKIMSRLNIKNCTQFISKVVLATAIKQQI